MEENERIYRRWVEELLNKGNEAIIDELFDPEGVAHYPYFLKSEEPIRGIENFRKFYKKIKETFSDLKVEISDLVIVEDKVISVCVINAFQERVNPEGLEVKEYGEVKSLCQYRIRDGKIFEIWNNVDLTDQNLKTPLLKL